MMIDMLVVVRRRGQGRRTFAAHAPSKLVACSSIIAQALGVRAPTILSTITERAIIIERLDSALGAGLAPSAGFGTAQAQTTQAKSAFEPSANAADSAVREEPGLTNGNARAPVGHCGGPTTFRALHIGITPAGRRVVKVLGVGAAFSHGAGL